MALVEETTPTLGAIPYGLPRADTDCDHFFSLNHPFWYSEVNAFLQLILCVCWSVQPIETLSFKDMPWHSGIQSQLESYGVIKFPGRKQGPSEVWNLVTFETSFLVSILPWLQVPLAAGDSFVLGCVPRLGNVFFVNNGVVQYVSICKDYKTWESLWSRFGVNPLAKSSK